MKILSNFKTMSEFFTPEVVWIIVRICIVVIIVLNGILNLNKVKNDTINNRLSHWANGKYFFITFFWGVLGGHFFLGSAKPLFCCNWWLPVFILVILVGILLLLRNKIKVKHYHQALLLIIGLAYGHYVWSQRHEEALFKDGNCENTAIFCKDD